jgi:hypothetical protein
MEAGMKAITMTRGSHRLGRFIKLGETLIVDDDIPLGVATELVETDRAVWGSDKTSAPKALETQSPPALKTRGPKGKGGTPRRRKAAAKA